MIFCKNLLYSIVPANSLLKNPRLSVKQTFLSALSEGGPSPECRQECLQHTFSTGC